MQVSMVMFDTGQNTGVGSLSLLQGIEPRSPTFRGILYQLSHKGSPTILEWLAYPFSSGSSKPRNQTRVSCITRAIREAPMFDIIYI